MVTNIYFNLKHETGAFTLRMLLLLRKVRTSLEAEPAFICNEVRSIGRSTDSEAMNAIVLWIAAQMGSNVTFIDGEFTCYDTLADDMDRTYGYKTWREEWLHVPNLQWRMRLAWVDRMIEELENECSCKGVDTSGLS